MNKYSEAYAKLSDKELIEVLKNEADYENDAIIVAKEEFEKRNISLETVDELTLELEESTKSDVFEKEYDFSNFLEIFKPIKKDNRKGEIYIKRLVFFYIIIGLYNSYFYFISISSTIKFLCTLDIFSMLSIVYLIISPAIILLMAYLLFKKKKIAWFYFTISSLYIAFSAPFSFFGLSSYWFAMGNVGFPYYQIFGILQQIAFNGFLFYYLWKKELRAELNINEKNLKTFKTIMIVIAVMTILFIAAAYFIGF